MNALSHNASLGTMQKMSTKIMATPQMQRNLAILMSPVQELQHEISLELESNPALEIKEDSIESMELIETNKNKGNESRQKKEFLEHLLTSSETLSEHLLWQLRMEDISERMFEIGEVLIQNLDENGFFNDDPYNLVSQLLQADRREVQEVIGIIQELEPIGCATHNSLESMHIQLSCLKINNRHRKMIDVCLDKIEELLSEKKANTKIEDIMQEFVHDVQFQEYFKKLVPYPGRAYVHNHIDKDIYVIPDAVISFEYDELVVKINQDIIPVLTINKSIEKSLGGDNKDATRLAKEWIYNANSFIDGLEFRANTLEKIISYLVKYHQEYFLNKSEFLKPLTRKRLAEELELNESTISRAISNKYVQSERGLFELKYFFSQRSGDNEDTSGQQIKGEIISIIDELKKSNEKISDRIISEKLVGKGFVIARRTVAKYRKQLEE